MKPRTKVSSKRAAAIAGRVLAGGRYSQNDVETLAASVVSQSPAKRSKAPAKKR